MKCLGKQRNERKRSSRLRRGIKNKEEEKREGMGNKRQHEKKRSQKGKVNPQVGGPFPRCGG
jgi:hypothetical protein